jgi:Flp pilus assembly protein TadD
VPSAVASDGETVKTMAPAPEPEPVEAQVVRAEDLLAEGEVARACALGEVAVARSPRLAAARGFLGRCYMREGQTDRARASYRAYLELAPDAPDAPFVRTIVEPKAR